MAAELVHLIELYRWHGLTQAAEQLSMLKTGLEAHGLIPSQLIEEPVATRPAPDITLSPTLPPALTGARRRLRLRYEDPPPVEERLDPRLPYELDAPGLPTRARTALVRAGCSKVDDVAFLVDHQMLRHVADVGARSAEQITGCDPRWASDRARQTPSKHAVPQLP